MVAATDRTMSGWYTLEVHVAQVALVMSVINFICQKKTSFVETIHKNTDKANRRLDETQEGLAIFVSCLKQLPME